MADKVMDLVDDVKSIGVDDVKREASGILVSWKEETLSSLNLGFTFASALAWNEVMKSFVSKLVKNGRSSVTQTTLYALTVTFLAGLVMYILKRSQMEKYRNRLMN